MFDEYYRRFNFLLGFIVLDFFEREGREQGSERSETIFEREGSEERSVENLSHAR
jgi:hypothetical protein